MRRILLWIAAWVVATHGWGGILPVARAQTPPSETVVEIELVSPHRVPQDLVRDAIGDLVGRPRSRAAIREALDRLWALRLFSEAWVEEVRDPDGLRLRFHLPRRPFVQSVTWKGEAGLSSAEAAAAAGLAVRGDAGPDRLEQARRDLLSWYAREGFFAAEVNVEAARDPATNARDVTFHLRAGQQARIGSLRIRGAIRVPPAELAEAFGLEEGDRYRQAEVRNGVRAVEERVRTAGFFEAEVTLGPPAWNRTTNRVDLDLEILEGREVRVEFAGNTHLKDAALRERLTFASTGVVDEIELRASARQLEAAYREEGYYFVEVSGSLDIEPDPRLVRFQIVEGPRVRVETVTFSGIQAFPAPRLLQLLETRPPGLLERGLFRQETLDRDLRVLLGFYRSQGFPKAVVGPAQVEFAEDRARARISLPIEEGPRVTVGRVQVEGAAARLPQEILADLPLKPGDPWDEVRADEGRRVVEQDYARRGYPNAEVTLETTWRDDTVDLTYRIREGTRTRVGRILVSGLVLTREQVVRRELPFREGDPFNPESLIEAERRLAALGLFEQVQVGPLQPPPEPFADVEIAIREGKPWRLDVGLGLTSYEGVRGFIEVGHDNLFGTGRKLSLREKVSRTVERTDLTYREPWLLGTRWQGEARLLRERRSERGFKLERAGGSVGIDRDLFPERIRGLHGGLQYRLEQVTRFDVDPSLAAEDVTSGSQLIASLTPSLTLDRRDSALNPKRGSLHRISLEGGGVPVGGEVNFLKSQVETSWFLDWLPPTVLALSARVGLATPLADTPDLAIEDRFFAGGSTTVRGYRENRVGPRDRSGHPRGGNGLIVLNAEWRFPIWRWLGGAVFLDSGAVTPQVSDLGAAAFKTGAGGGLRLETPVGPIRVDVGYALTPIPGEDRWQVYFSVGHPF